MGDIAKLLPRGSACDGTAKDTLFEAPCPELRRLAHSRLALGRPTLLETGVLVRECYLCFASAGSLETWEREGFLAYAVHAVRSIIVDPARERMAEAEIASALDVTERAVRCDWGKAQAPPADAFRA